MLIDFSNLDLPKKPNWCLALPADWKDQRAAIQTPYYNVPIEKLREALIMAIRDEPRTNLLRLDKEARQAEFEQRSKLFGFADRIVVEFVELRPDRSSLALYSRSTTGYWDLGVNCGRLRKWLSLVEAKLRKMT